MQRKKVIVIVAALAAALGWYLFRPELLFVNETVNEGFPEAAVAKPAVVPAAAPAPMVEVSGRFQGVAHKTTGVATIHRLDDGRRILRLTEFETSNGPDVQVYLVAAADARDNDSVKKAGFINVGALKGNQGDQNYDVPADVDLNRYQAVTIWCRRFGVNFGTAALKTGNSSTATPSTSSSAPAAQLAGQFHGVAHKTSGTAAIYRLPDGRRVLRFTGFETSNGPDVQVYLVAANDANDNDTVTKAGFINVGALKGNKGDQNYDVPASVDLERYRAVTVWCRRFGVNFGTAPLAPPQMSASR